MRPELQAFVILCNFLLVASPVAAWSVIPGKGENSTKLWFLGAGCLAAVGNIYYIESRWVTAYFTANFAAAVFALEALSQESRPEDIPWVRMLGIIVAAAVLHAASEEALQAGWITAAMQLAPRVFVFTVLEGWILVRALRLAHAQRSRGLLLVAVGLAPLVLANAARLAAIAAGSGEMGPEATSKAFPVLAALLTLTAVTYNFGFLAFALEKSHVRTLVAQANEASAQARERAALEHGRELQQLIAQRDELLMSSTRLSAVSALGLYNAAIVHEISQPLQALRSSLDGMKLLLERETDSKARDHLLPELDQAINLNSKASVVIQSLRRLITSRPTALMPISPHEAIRAVLPVIGAECQRRGVRLTVQLAQDLDSARVPGDLLLLQRTVMNLVGNGLDALSPVSSGSRQIHLLTEEVALRGKPALRLRIEDSGPGLPHAVLSAPKGSLVTFKADGMGMGLTLARLIMAAWDGDLDLGTAQELGGAQIDLVMPRA
jgi:C4-dicarboxylate-specific signal transduction histidine kinase